MGGAEARVDGEGGFAEGGFVVVDGGGAGVGGGWGWVWVCGCGGEFSDDALVGGEGLLVDEESGWVLAWCCGGGS